MNDLARVLALTWLAGLAMPAGALLGTVDSLRPNWLGNEFRHGVIAFGGGALLSAIALVLVPEGVEHLSPATVAFWFAAGGVSFLGLDLLLASWNSPAGQLAAMLSDFFPEALALGAADSGAPGMRSEYSENYYAAFITDADGNKIEVLTFVS